MDHVSQMKATTIRPVNYGITDDEDDDDDDEVFEESTTDSNHLYNKSNLDLRVRKEDQVSSTDTGYRGYVVPTVPAAQEESVVEEILHKTILVGDSGVGKTSLLVQFDTGTFHPSSFAATVGIGFTMCVQRCCCVQPDCACLHRSYEEGHDIYATYIRHSKYCVSNRCSPHLPNLNMLALAQLTTAYNNNQQQQQDQTSPTATGGNARSAGTEFRYIKVRSGSIRSRSSKETARVHVEDANYYEFRRASLGNSAEADPTCAQFKVMLLGDSGVGKTCFLLRFTDKTFLSGSFIATVGIDFRNKVLTVDGTKVKLQIWDTAGQERFRSVTHAYYRDAHALFLLYDVTNRRSFDNTRAWLAEINEYAHRDVIIMLLGNKCDSEDRVVDREDGERLAREYRVNFMETSAKTGLNVLGAFTEVARALRDKRTTVADTTSYGVKEYVEPNQWMSRNSCAPCSTS